MCTINTQIEQSFKRILEQVQEKENLNHLTDTYYNTLIQLLVDEFGFRRNMYHCVGSYDLVSWVLLCFNPSHSKHRFETILKLIAYLSIADDALDEDYSKESISEMNIHHDILNGNQSIKSKPNPATSFANHMVDILNSDEFYSSIKEMSIDFLKTGIDLLKRGECTHQHITRKDLYQFLKERRVDSMAKLFIEIKLKTQDLEMPANSEAFTEYVNMGCDIISLINDIASISKDVSKNVTNNYLMLHTCMKRKIDTSQLSGLNLSDYIPSLEYVLTTIEQMMEKMQFIKDSHPLFEEEYNAIDEIVKGYSTWCFTSARFQQKDHIMDHFKMANNGIPKLPFEKLKPQSKDMNTYFMDIKDKLSNSNL